MMTTMDLVPAAETREILKKVPDLKTAAAAVVAIEAVEVEETKPFPSVPKARILTDAMAKVLRAVPKLYGKVQLDRRRTLTEAELKAVFDEHQLLDAAKKNFESRIEDLKEMVRTHLDVMAEERGIAIPKTSKRMVKGEEKILAEATLRDPKGHYILTPGVGHSFRLPIPGTDKEYSQEWHSGGVTIDGERLLEMYEAGELTREEYLGFTREARVLDEDKATRWINKNPERGYEIMTRITVQKPPSTSLCIRKA